MHLDLTSACKGLRSTLSWESAECLQQSGQADAQNKQARRKFCAGGGCSSALQQRKPWSQLHRKDGPSVQAMHRRGYRKDIRQGFRPGRKRIGELTGWEARTL